MGVASPTGGGDVPRTPFNERSWRQGRGTSRPPPRRAASPTGAILHRYRVRVVHPLTRFPVKTPRRILSRPRARLSRANRHALPAPSGGGGRRPRERPGGGGGLPHMEKEVWLRSRRPAAGNGPDRFRCPLPPAGQRRWTHRNMRTQSFFWSMKNSYPYSPACFRKISISRRANSICAIAPGLPATSGSRSSIRLRTWA